VLAWIRRVTRRKGKRAKSTPRLAIFLIPLPEPLPLPHGSTLAFTGEHIPLLEGYEIAPTHDLPPYPEWASARQITSLKAWQVIREETYVTERETMDIVHRVTRSIVPETALAELRKEYERWEAEEFGRAGNEASFQDPPEELAWSAEVDEGARTTNSNVTDGLDAPDTPPLSVAREYMTIIEGVTLLNHDDQPDPLSAAFDRVVDAIAEAVRAYRVSSRRPVAPITRERLPFSIYFLLRNVIEPYEWGHSLFMTHLNPPGPIPYEVFTPEQLEQFQRYIGLGRRGHPLFPFVERALDAERVLTISGDTANAVILAQVSVEIFLDTVLELLLLDEGAEAGTAVSMLDDPLLRKVRRYFPERLGGDWNSDSGLIGMWHERANTLRGRVVHAGYTPSREEAWDAIRACRELESFVRGQIAQKATRYPRAALVVLGRPGLESRAAWGRRVAKLADELGDPLEAHAAWMSQLERARSDCDEAKPTVA
jgi:hypothetical protein